VRYAWKMNRPLLVSCIALAASAIGVACIGEDAVGGGPAGPPADASAEPQADASSAADTSPPDGASPGVDAGGPRCAPDKPFATVDRLKGISTGDDETGVWVSADELTAYVAVTPLGGGGSSIRKSTRPSPGADFSAPTDDPQLAAMNGGGFVVAVPSMTSDGLVFFASRANGGAGDGIYVSSRPSTAAAFGTPERARSRGNPFSLGDPFITPGGESLLVARDNGVNSFELDEAPRDVGMIYGDGGFVDYAIAPGVVNVNDSVAADRRPVVSKDRLTLVFASNRAPGSGTDSDIYLASRAGVGGTFTSPLRLPEPVSSNAADLPGTLSEDGCALYFTSSRAGGFGGFDVYVALRGK
jgi:hypothetical protein